MSRWLALGSLLLVLGCTPEKGTWGPKCDAYRQTVRDDCKKFGEKTPSWKTVCKGYLDSVDTLEKSAGAGTVQKKYDAIEEECMTITKEFRDNTKDPERFPRQ